MPRTPGQARIHTKTRDGLSSEAALPHGLATSMSGPRRLVGLYGINDYDTEVLDKVDEALGDLAQFEFDPVGFVLYAFPWGEANTTLAKEEGPEAWQLAQLERIGRKLRAGGDMGAVIEEDVVAGHGVGKSAVVAWIILWAISTKVDTRGVVTANTEAQLKTKTWAELGKWHALFTNKELFKLTATALISSDKRHERTWRVDMIPWSETNADAFAGLHNRGKRQFMLFDEASQIADSIWDTAEGFLTDAMTQVLWLRYGNPTQTSGRFHRNCTRRGSNHVTKVDARTVRFANKTKIAQWIEMYGEDSDFVRVRVRGQFPRAGISNFIGFDVVEEARLRRVPRMAYIAYPLYLGIDPARFGNDWTVLTLRQGLHVHWQQGMYGFDGPDVAGRVVELLTQFSGISVIVYDAAGNGADLDSQLRRIPNLQPTLVPVTWGIPAKESKQYFNQRTEAWAHTRDWLKEGSIPDDDELADQLCSLMYGYDNALRQQLETKEDAKARGIQSPDKADSLALTLIPDLVMSVTAQAKVRRVVKKQVIWTRNA